MKHLLLNLIIACAALTVTMPSYADGVQVKGDTVIAISGTDTVQLSAKSVAAAMAGIIDDTLAGNDADFNSLDSDDRADAIEMASQREYYANRDEAERKLALQITVFVCGTIVVLLVLVLCFWYLHRRMKYHMMERAIDNNYPLYQQPVQPAQYVYQPGPQQQPASSAQQSQQQPPQQSQIKAQFLNGQINYNTKQFKSAYVMIAVGLALALAFLFENALFMFFVMLIVALIGAGKFALAYQEQQSFIQAQQQHDAWSQQQQQQQQPPQFDPNNHNNNSQQQPKA